MVEYKVTKNDLIGDIEGFPIEVVQKMVEEQVKQGDDADVTAFQESHYGGFFWLKTKDGADFWNEVICWKNFKLFFEKYPKSKHSDSQIETIEINGKKYKKN